MSEPRRDDLVERLEEALRSGQISRVRAVVEGERARLEAASSDVLPPLDREVTLGDVARFVREVIVRAHSNAGRFVVAPLVPVIGLPGSGKTSFLTALGHMLTEQRARYHFPYEGDFVVEPLSLGELVRQAGGEPAHAEALKPWVLDFGFEFARKRTEAFFRHASFPPRTTLAKGARFLVAQVRKDGAPYARLVSFEVEGEALRPIFRAGSAPDPQKAFRALEDEATPTGVAADALDRATGIVLLVDSTRPVGMRGEAHAPLFELIARALRKRAQQALAARAQELEAEERSGDRRTLEGAILRLRRSEGRFGEELCLEVEGSLLRALADALEPGAEPLERGDLRRFLRELAALPGERPLVQAIGARLIQGLSRPDAARNTPEVPELDSWARAVARLRGVPLDVARRLAAHESLAGEPELFLQLRGLSVVETKSDVGRPVSPFELPGCRAWLEEIRGSLRLVGGDLRTYESSVAGYAGLLGARYAPGPFSTQTPLHVLEPVFDLLGVPRDEGAA